MAAMDQAVDSADYHTGSIWDMPLVYSAAVRAKAGTLLDEAALCAPSQSVYAERIAITRNWQPIRTSSRTWSDQGLRYYKGLAWYRQTLDIPAEAQGRRVFLWFGAIDEAAKVWVNGRPIGISPKIVFKPFELDATEAIRPGKPNTVVVCVANETLNELGTGGIMGPVMFYLPADGNDAQLENSQPLGTVFPEY